MCVYETRVSSPSAVYCCWERNFGYGTRMIVLVNIIPQDVALRTKIHRVYAIMTCRKIHFVIRSHAAAHECGAIGI